jgi:hypothetical protein
MDLMRSNFIRWLYDSRLGPTGRLAPRWIFLRALGAIYFSAFYALLFQIKGLIGPEGIQPAQSYLTAVAQSFAGARFWYAPTLLWFSARSPILMAVMWIGLAAAVAAFLNLWPRLSFFVCFICYLSFVAAAGEFSSYQSDGMLLEAGFLAQFLAPPGMRPGWGADHPASRASYFLLQWEWFRIYFESGLVKLLSGDPEWRSLTAMDEYYQNGPLPTWIGWYVEHLPHWFQVATAASTLTLELGLVWMLFFPRRVRLLCFCIVTPWEIGVILTANYTFLNYLVLSLGFLLLDDKAVMQFVPKRLRPRVAESAPSPELRKEPSLSILAVPEPSALEGDSKTTRADAHSRIVGPRGLAIIYRTAGLALAAVLLSWIGYNTTAELIGILLRGVPLPTAPIAALAPFRIANEYGLFAVMTRGRYEIEFQGSNDGENWTPYPFRYKPQAVNEPPHIYAPYQPRFDWNLWFASLGSWRDDNLVPLVEERLLVNDTDVIALFKSNPFPQSPPRYMRAVLWQYWFTMTNEKRRTGDWWHRQLMGLYAPEIKLAADGSFEVVEWPAELPPHD